MDVQFKRDESLSIVRTHAFLTSPGTVHTLTDSCSPGYSYSLGWMDSLRGSYSPYIVNSFGWINFLRQKYIFQIIFINYNFVCKDF